MIFVIEKGKLGEYEEALLVAERHGVRAHVSLDIFPHVLARPVLEELDGIPLLSFTTTPSNPGRARRQAGDRPGAVARALPRHAADPGRSRRSRSCSSSGAPVLFRQVRCGLNGRHFTLLKFRTMEPGAEERLPEISHLNEMTGPVFKVAARPAADAGRAAPAPPLDRRAAAALERDRGRHEPRRPASAAAGGGRALRAVAAPAAQR